jgi:hypothetical protein
MRTGIGPRKGSDVHHEDIAVKLKIEQVGNPDFARYAIIAENQTWWDGEKWTPEKKAAMLYASLPVINRDFKRLEEEIASTLIELICTVNVKITGLKEITDQQIEALAWFLSTASGFTLDYSRPLPPGLDNVSCQIKWASLKRKRKSGSG